MQQCKKDTTETNNDKLGNEDMPVSTEALIFETYALFS